MLRVVCSRTSFSGTASVFFGLQLSGIAGIIFDIIVRSHIE